MKTYAEVVDDIIVNYCCFCDEAEIPDGYIDVTGITCNIGDPVSAGVPAPKPSPYHIVDGGAWVWQQADHITARCREAVAILMSKYSAGFEYSSKTYQIDKESQFFIMTRFNYANLSISDPATYSWSGGYMLWTDVDNADISFGNAAAFITFAAAVYAHCEPLNRACKVHKKAIKLLGSFEDVRDYDLTIGW